MEHKTKIEAEVNKQELLITRIFDLPVDLLFKSHTESELIEQWMGNKVLKLENHAHGSYLFETTNEQGKVMFRANGSIHKIVENESIIRTFEMENTGFPVQLEFLDFEHVSEEKSKLTMKIVFRSVPDRDNLLKLPFAQGINMAHDRLEKLIGKLK